MTWCSSASDYNMSIFDVMISPRQGDAHQSGQIIELQSSLSAPRIHGQLVGAPSVTLGTVICGVILSAVCQS
jgi:hypothetical protein